MKIRTDFVTNSSSSSFCVMNVELKNGDEIRWEDERCRECPLFMFTRNTEADIKAVSSVNELVNFLLSCARDVDGRNMEKEFSEGCAEFLDSVRSLKSIEEITSLKMTWGEFMSDQGFTPDEGCYGGQLRYRFDNGECELVCEADEDFIAMMNDMFCYD